MMMSSRASNPSPSYTQRVLLPGLSREGRVGAGGGVDSRDAVAKPTGTYSRRPPPDTTRPGQPKNPGVLGYNPACTQALQEVANVNPQPTPYHRGHPLVARLGWERTGGHAAPACLSRYNLLALGCGIFLFLWIWAGQAAAAGLEASVDRTRLVEGESLLLTLSGAGDVWGTPDTGPLARDFGVQNQGQGTSTVMTNGRVTTTREWRLLLSPKAVGRLTIPALKVGDLESAPISIEVLPASQAAQVGELPAARLEAELDRDSVYVQGQAVYSLRVLLRPQVQNASLEDPKAEGVQFERLGEDRVSETQRDGQRYHVIERRYALLPQHSGAIEIQAPVLSAAVPETRQRGGRSGGPPGGSPFGPGESPFEHFFGRDPFADMDGLISRARPIQVRGPTLTLEVKPQPAGAPLPWLPAEDLHLAETWTPDPSQARVGEPLTRTIAITAQGLSATQLPDLSSAVPDGVKLYPDKPRTETRAEGDTLVAVKEIRQALVPAVAGKLMLPEVRLAWWDTRENKEKVAVLPERTLEVQAASGPVGDRSKGKGAAPVAPALVPGKAPASGSASSAAPGAVKSAEAESLPAAEQAVTGWSLPAGYWPWLALGLGLAWLLTLLFWWLERRRLSRPRPFPELAEGRSSVTLAAALESVREACDTGDPRAARTALLAWGQACWPHDPPKRIEILADRLATCCEGGACVGDAASSLRLLDQSLYAPGVMSWDGPTAWRYLQPALGAVAKAARSVRAAADPLPGLYPKKI